MKVDCKHVGGKEIVKVSEFNNDIWRMRYENETKEEKKVGREAYGGNWCGWRRNTFQELNLCYVSEV